MDEVRRVDKGGKRFCRQVSCSLLFSCCKTVLDGLVLREFLLGIIVLGGEFLDSTIKDLSVIVSIRLILAQKCGGLDDQIEKAVL